MVDLQRRKFLTAMVPKDQEDTDQKETARHKSSVRPPWAIIDDTAFSSCCSQCLECARICPQGIIKTDNRGYPCVDFSQSGCELCGDCVDVCKDGALIKKNKKVKPWQHRVTIREQCLLQQKVICRSCVEACDEDAIRYQLIPGGLAQINIRTKRCNGCGFCIATCPVKAITVDFTAVVEEKKQNTKSK